MKGVSAASADPLPARAQAADGGEDVTGTLVLELRGDCFIAQQPRRVVGAAVAMQRGWLPANYWEQAIPPPASPVATERLLAPRAGP